MTSAAVTDKERCVLLIDMDCFYVQVEHGLQPHTMGQPAVVVQYRAWRGGGIIAVNYEARAAGVKRGHHADEALRLCPQLVLFRVPERGGKANLDRYRQAGARVLQVLQRFSSTVERASVDEAYVQLWPNDEQMQLAASDDKTFLANSLVVGLATENSDSEGANGVDGCDQEEGGGRRQMVKRGVTRLIERLNSDAATDADRLLAAGAVLCEKIRRAVLAETGYRCSAGVAHNKLLAKLVASMNKPDGQTVLLQSQVQPLLATTPLQKLRHLGGKLGATVVDRLQCRSLADLAMVDEAILSSMFDQKTARWLYQLARGIDSEPVTARLLAKSIGCGRNFRGAETLRCGARVRQWVSQLAEEMAERLQVDTAANGRRATSLTVTATSECGRHTSRCTSLRHSSAEHIAADAFRLLAQMSAGGGQSEIERGGGDVWRPALVNVSICASRFVDHSSANIADLLSRVAASTGSSRGEGVDSDIPAMLSSGDGVALQCRPNAESSRQGSSAGGYADAADSDIGLTDTRSKSTHANSASAAVPGSDQIDENRLDEMATETDDLTEEGCLNIVASQEKGGFFAGRMHRSSAHPSADTVDTNNEQSERSIGEDSGGGCDSGGSTIRADSSTIVSLSHCLRGSDDSMDDNSAEGRASAAELGVENTQAGACVNFVEEDVVCDDTTPCPRCRRQVSPWTLPEHLDWHVAVELSREQGEPAQPAQLSTVSRRRPASRSARRGTRSKRARSAGLCGRRNATIDRYFSAS